MRSKSGSLKTSVFAFVPVLAILFAAVPRGDARVSAWSGCALDPDTVAVQEQNVTVAYTAPDSVGVISSVTAPEDSGLRVDSIDNQNKTFALNTSTAKEGDWQLNLIGAEQKSCTAALTVQRPNNSR